MPYLAAELQVRSTITTMLNSISTTPDEDGDFLGYGIFRSTKISSTDVFIGHDGSGPGYRSVMFYQPDKKMTIAILTNYHGAKLYDVAKALYESLPDFICKDRNRREEDKHNKEDKILICYNGHNLCVDRNAAAAHIRNGAYLGQCERRHQHHETGSGSRIINETPGTASENPIIKLYPNPFNDQITVTFKTTISGKVNISLYDINGKKVAIVFNGFAEKGVLQKVEFKTTNLSPGIYFSRIQTENETSQEKIVLMR